MTMELADADQRLRHIGERMQWMLAACAVVGIIALDRVLPLVAGDRFAAATPAMVPVIAMLPFLQLSAMAVPSSSLRLNRTSPLRSTPSVLSRSSRLRSHWFHAGEPLAPLRRCSWRL
jgi:hypothetical protein